MTLEGIEDATTLRLAGVGALRLVCIAAPLWGRHSERLEVDRTRAAYLAALSGQSSLRVAVLGNDRYGRPLGLVRLSDGRLLQETLLARGLVLAWPDELASEMADRFLAVEEQARAQQAGLWSPEVPFVADAGTVRARPSRLALVEGTVQDVGSSASAIYLNFGTDRDRDFTCRIDSRHKNSFAAAGRSPDAMTGRKLRVRGWLFDWSGPMIDVLDPRQIAFVDG